MIHKGDMILDSLEAWERLAGPKSSVQWQDYRSAKECARAWLGQTGSPGIPEELEHVLATHEHFDDILAWEAEPECLVSFDEYGGPANVDVLLSGQDRFGRFVMAIEAKADESFGPLVSGALSAALERHLRSASSKGLKRIEQLTPHLFSPAERGSPPLHQIRYQLMTATAAALSRAKAEGADRAVLMIQEFVTPRTDPKNRARNSRDLLRFLMRLGVQDADRALQGELVGPVRVPGGAKFTDPPKLYIGKAVRSVANRDT